MQKFPFSLGGIAARRCLVLFACAAAALSNASTVLAAVPTRVLKNNAWSMIALPGQPPAGSTVRSLFGDDLPEATFRTKWTLFAVGAGGVTTQLTLDSALSSGKGYWMIQATGADVTVDLPDSTVPIAIARRRGCASVSGCSSVELLTGTKPVNWNMLGASNSAPVPIDAMRVTVANTACRWGCDLEALDASGIVRTRVADSTRPSGFKSVIYRYNQETSAYERMEPGTTVEPWQALWVPVLPDQGAGIEWLTPRPKPARTVPSTSDYELVFDDEFTGPKLDPSKWRTSPLWGPYVIINREEQFYVDTLGAHRGAVQNPFVFTGEGTMKIVATKTNRGADVPPRPAPNDPKWGSLPDYYRTVPLDESTVNYLSGILTSYDGFKFAQGYFEVRAKLPAGQGLWPAFWALPAHYVDLIPEIDVMEVLGQDRNLAYQTYHWFDPRSGGTVARRTPSFQVLGPDLSADFHTFGLAWEPGQIMYYIDGIEVRRVREGDPTLYGGATVQIPRQSMFLLLNLAVGGSWPGAPDANTEFPAEYEIDYVRAYRKSMSTPVKLSEYTIAFRDEFDAPVGDEVIDPAKWRTSWSWGPFDPLDFERDYDVDVLGIDRDQAYTPFSIADGALVIRAAETGTEPEGNQPQPQRAEDDPFWDSLPRKDWYRADYVPRDYTSGLLSSHASFDFVNGYVEVRAKVPGGAGTCSFFGLRHAYTVGTLAELDVMRISGDDATELGQDYRYSSRGLPEGTPHRTTRAAGFDDGFHTYGMQWQVGRIVWFVDGREVHRMEEPNAAYQLQYAFLGLGVDPVCEGLSATGAGGQGFAPVLPSELAIDHVRIYREKNQS